MSPSLAALGFLLLASASLAQLAHSPGERISFVVSAWLLVFAMLEEVGRSMAGLSRRAGVYLDVAAVFAFLAQLALVSYRFVVLR